MYGKRIREILDFDMIVKEKTGEIPDKKRHADIRSIIFTYDPRSGRVSMRGSTHKFANGGKKNNDRFTYNRFMRVVDELKDFISPEDRINVLEFGLNITTPFPPSDYLHDLIAHKKRRFNKDKTSAKGYYEAIHSQYRLKIYDKSIYQGGTNILRIEIHVNKMQWLSKSFPGGLTWGALQTPETWMILGRYLINTFNEIIYYDPGVEEANLSTEERGFVEKCNNPFFWERLTGSHQERIQQRFQGLIDKYGTKYNTIKNLLNEELRCVLPNNLAEIYHKDETILGKSEESYSNDMAEIYHLRKEDQGSQISIKDTALAEIYPTLDGKVLNSSDSGRRCIITGLDISMQKPGSRFLNTNGLKYLYENDRKMYDQLLSEIPSKWHNESLKKQFYKIAHYLRDKLTNPRTYYRTAIQKLMSEPALFNNEELISEKAIAIAKMP